MREKNARWSAYRSAVVRIELSDGPVLVEPRPAGEADGGFPFVDGATVHIITAYDSASLDDPRNDLRLSELKDVLDDLEIDWVDAVGADPEWRHQEPSVAVLDLGDERARRIGLRYQQDAIFRWTAHSWELVDCASGASETMGWHCTRVDV